MKTKLLLCLLVLTSAMARAGAIRQLPGFLTTVYGPNDDDTYPVTSSSGGNPVQVPIGFPVNFYGQTFSNLYVNNNGNVTFDRPLGEYTPFGLLGTLEQIIAPFFADVDTRAGNLVTFGNDVVDGHPAFGVNWIGVGYFSMETDKTNSFQLILINRSDRNPGDFDIEFNYDSVQWETGDASGGTDGLGGSPAVAGFSNGSKRPGTSLQFPGSGISRSFLDSNPGGLIHKSLNSDVLGRYVIPIINLTNTVLTVQRFSQYDSRWAANPYGNTLRTIQDQGSALCCLAMALKYVGIPTDPAQLNTLLKADNDFDESAVNWGPATRDASTDTLEFHAHRTSDMPYLSQILSLGFPIIVKVANPYGGGSHFVLVIGEKDGQFLISDPGNANATTLDFYNNDFETRGYVSDPPGDVSELDFAAGDTTELLVVDPLGRRSGYDPASGEVLEEIPQSVHFWDAIENSDLTGQPGTNAAHLVYIAQPIAGIYQIFLTSLKSGAYHCDLRSFLPDGSSGTSLTVQGTTPANRLTSYQVNLGSGGVALQPFTNQYAWSASPTNGIAPLAVQFTAPNTDNAGHSVTNWYWTFGNGENSSDQLPLTTYQTGGTFFPSLVAINDTGSTLVSYGPSIFIPAVPFTANPTNGVAPLTVQFNAASADTSGNSVGGWNWNFGDGFTDAEQNPTHTYTVPGFFVPTLTATNGSGDIIHGIGPTITVLHTDIANGGFETGDLTNWTLLGGSFTQVDDGSGGIPPHSGGFLALLGTAGDIGSLAQTFVTAPGRLYAVSLWLNSPDGAIPNEFHVRWNGDAIFDATNLPALGWTNIQFTAMAVSKMTTLEFDYVNDLSYFGLDDVTILPAPENPPHLAIAHAGQNLVFTWPTNSGRFTLQFTTNLNQTSGWNAAPNGPVILGGQSVQTNPLPANRTLFYRLAQ